MSDLIDQLKYEELEVDEKLAGAYGEVFNGSDASKIVLADLMRICGYGMYSALPEEQTRIMERSTVIFNIKQMLNGKPVEIEEEEEENE